MSLQEIDEVTITVLMDNSTDLLLTNSEHAIRMPLVLKENQLTASNSRTWIFSLS